VSLNAQHIMSGASQNGCVIREFLGGGSIRMHQCLHSETLRGLNRPQLVSVHPLSGGGRFSDRDESVNDRNMRDDTSGTPLECVENSIKYVVGHQCPGCVMNQNVCGSRRESGQALLNTVPSGLASDNDVHRLHAGG
jgi:hypothetical protein